jgi:hypothetical protein
MDNQHQKINGIRDFNQAEVDLLNNIQKMSNSVGMFVDGLAAIEGIDRRWLGVAQTDLQKGFMAMKRAIEKPEGF